MARATKDHFAKAAERHIECARLSAGNGVGRKDCYINCAGNCEYSVARLFRHLHVGSTSSHRRPNIERINEQGSEVPWVTLSPLKAVLEGYEEIAQSRWLAWLRKQRLDAAIPNDFSAVLNAIEMFSDPAISNVAMETSNTRVGVALVTLVSPH
jgi:hypothetical protein